MRKLAVRFAARRTKLSRIDSIFFAEAGAVASSSSAASAAAAAFGAFVSFSAVVSHPPAMTGKLGLRCDASCTNAY